MLKILIKIYIAFIYILFYLPVVLLIIYSFNESQYSEGIFDKKTISWYIKLLDNNALLSSAQNTILVAIISASLSVLIAIIFALGLNKYQFSGKNFVLSIIYVLIVSPDITLGISLLALFKILHINLGFTTVLLSHIIFSIAFILVILLSEIENLNKSMLRSAQDLGANEWQIFRLIILPNLKPTIIFSWFFAFTISLDDVIVSFFVSGPGIELLQLNLFSMMRLGINPEASALSSIMFVITLISVCISYCNFRKKL
ncbi:ABC transporter permease subunit [Rickettsia endosymbiont of Cardiosporidium cionae]|uniref:ABC transporter permease subunit n=1 Tax=Rickettsia endosymbiont of Cardiosporidium cionae TaxID=2777155 RepID=UPI001894162E|nr:ABC transporter permease subunit [Rickettsia endosymbiont of Cardiosporidium cionae]KAF8818669.1 hypothetical protein IHI24_000394 [Rickettsia endosymbiont of Cardiosporidium cionae]